MTDHSDTAIRTSRMTRLPRWPLFAMFSLYPLWWVLGLGSIAWIPLGACMAVLLVRRGDVRVPAGLSIWFLFLLLMCVSVIGLDSPGRLIGFVYRVLQYASVTTVFLYVYNAREMLTVRYVLGLVAAFWAFAVVGGYAGIFFPTFSFRTPFGVIVPSSLASNEVVGEMVERRMTQHNPDSWFAMDPRPSAPFLYTNQWGNVYSLCLPMVLAYVRELLLARDRAKALGVAVLILLSLVPALLTLNRGMFLGIAVAVAYVMVRFLLAGRLQPVMWTLALGIATGVVTVWLGVGSRLEERTTTSSSTEDRASLYRETFDRTLDSPIFGYGAPRPSVTEGLPSAGTQGHVWTVMFSHGLPALALFLLALVWLGISTASVRNTSQLLVHSVQVIILVEVMYYGVLPNGLILSFTAAALLLRERDARIDANSARRRGHAPLIGRRPESSLMRA